MIEFTVRTVKDKQGGASPEFDIKAGPESPTKTELAVLSGYLTPTAQKILGDWLEANERQPQT